MHRILAIIKRKSNDFDILVKKICHAVVLCYNSKEFQKTLDCFNWKNKFSVFKNFHFPQDRVVTHNEDVMEIFKKYTIIILSKIDFHFRGPK